MALFSAMGRQIHLQMTGLLPLDIFVSSQGAKEGFEQATCPQPECLKGFCF